tara:strand:+ start:656 stop:1777 length:1122 start_codon:yes stop_codon:yes gene_type:complete
MKKLIYQKFLKDTFLFFLSISLTFGVIIWVIQAVNFLDFITEDGHSLYVYFNYTFLNFPKIIHKLLPFIFFLSLFLQLLKYETNNELLIFWTNGIKKLSLINIILLYSFMILIIQLLLSNFLSPAGQDKARSYLRNSSSDFLPSLIQEGKFIDAISDVTLFIEAQHENGDFKNLFLKEGGENRFQIIHAKKGVLVSNAGENKYFEFFDGTLIDSNNNIITSFDFDKINFSLSKYISKSTLYPKIQETPTIDLFKCAYHYSMNTINAFKAEWLMCDKSSVDQIKVELFKRTIQPFYIPLLALICSLLLLKSKENRFYSNLKIYLFLVAFLIIILSELLLKYTGTMNGFIIFISLPFLLFVSTYLYLIKKFKIKI